jgi:hypothetical protein
MCLRIVTAVANWQQTERLCWTKVNAFQGFMVGNAWTDATIDNRGAVDFWHAHALISDATHSAIAGSCDFNRVGPLETQPLVRPVLPLP